VVCAAAMFLSLESGQVQGWSDHPAGGFQGAFHGVHAAGDYVAALATDLANRFLFSATTLGYVKVWLMTNYLSEEKVSLWGTLVLKLVITLFIFSKNYHAIMGHFNTLCNTQHTLFCKLQNSRITTHSL
jgi:hypothetical protein